MVELKYRSVNAMASRLQGPGHNHVPTGSQAMIDRETSSSWISVFHNHLMGGRQVILTDDVVDRFLVNGQYQSLSGFLDWYLPGQGYEVVGHYDSVDGLRFAAAEMQNTFVRVAAPSSGENGGAGSTASASPPRPGSFAPTQSASGGMMGTPGAAGPGQARATGPGMQQPSCTAPVSRMPARQDPEEVLRLIRQALRQTETPVAMIIDFADKLVSDPEHQPEEERKLTVLLEKIIEEAAFLKRGKLQGRRNVLVIVAKNSALFLLAVPRHPLVTVLRLSRPDQNESPIVFCPSSRNLPRWRGDSSRAAKTNHQHLWGHYGRADGMGPRDDPADQRGGANLRATTERTRGLF